MRRCFAWVLIALVLPWWAGCKPRAAGLTPLQRKQAASLVSEADFAVTLKDLPRAEALYRQALELGPDVPGYWQNLGIIQRQQGNLKGARSAYQQALALYADAYKAGGKTESLVQQVWLLSLLGRNADVEKLIRRAQADHPDDPVVRQLADPKKLDAMRHSPDFLAIAL
jgi:Flp pilus assembly protein TadD